MRPIQRARSYFVISAFFLALFATTAYAGHEAIPREQDITAAPSRPNYANTADILQDGVVEFEYGFSYSWFGAEGAQLDVSGLVRFSVTPMVEVRVASDNLTMTSQSGQLAAGLGDTWVAAQHEFRKQSASLPALAVSYALKVPTAHASNDLGTGRFDHALSFLGNKSYGQNVLCFNVTYTEAGEPSAPGFDHNVFLAGNIARPLYKKLGFTAELYGATRLDSDSVGYMGTLWAVTYTYSPRLVFDGGVDLGITAGLPHQRAYVGLSYALGEVYH